MSFPLTQYVYVVLGVVISVVLPVLRKQLPPTFVPLLANSVPAKVYLAVGLFSLITAFLLVAYAGQDASTWAWYTAVIAGFAWDSTLQKITHG